MTTEHVYQHQMLLPWLTAPLNQGGLGWTMPAAGNGTNNAVDPATGLLWADTLDFLRSGNSANALAWSALVAAQRKEGGAQGAQERAEQAAGQALEARMAGVDTVLEALRSGLTVEGLKFSLWNRKPSTGDTTAVLAQDNYSRNILRASPEVSVVGEGAPEGALIEKARERPRVRLDIAFHINGLPLGYLEVKAEGSGQTAFAQGREQLAQDFLAFAVPGLLRLHAEHEATEGRAWPGLAAGGKRLTDVWKRRAINALPWWFTKTAWRATLDMERVFMAGSPWEALLEVDAALMDMALGRRAAGGHPIPWSERYPQLLKTLMGMMARQLPAVLLDMPADDRCGWDQPRAHLEALLGTIGLDQEIQLFGHPTRRKDSNAVAARELVAPRVPQRVALGQIRAWTEKMYAHESDPGWLERDLRARLQASMPGLSAEDIERRVNERLRFRNGQEAYSIVIQGAAGVGKTHLATWTSLTLHSLLEHDASGRPTSQPMFDYIVVLTDRVELRKNIAESAELSNGSRGMVTEITTAGLLSKVLSGNAPRGTGRILVVNLQKFPSLLEKLRKGEAAIKRNGGRIAFIIDEVHRSNQGKLNTQAQEAFLDEMGQLGADQGGAGKKNLIVGLTATPIDPILARFGLWRSGTGAGDPGTWTPHFAYGMRQAIDDGYVLDALASLVRLETVLDIDRARSIESVDGDSSRLAGEVDSLALYEDPGYQAHVAEAFARIFLTTTMPAIRDNHNANRVGRGKAMITAPSVKAAIGMHAAIKDALTRLAENAEGTPWERHADIAQDVADERTFILYSDPGKRATVAQREDTGIDGGCGPLNPLINNTVRTEAQIIEGFRCKEAGSDGNARNAIMVVVDKLLTGFDEDTLHTLMIARNLTGVALLQTMCRVNRTRPGKDNCLVIDASYDPKGEGLGPEAARVFKRYNGLATSHLDGLDLLRRVATQRVDLLRHKRLAAGWKAWQRAQGQEDKQLTAMSLAAQDIKEGPEGLVGAAALRRKIGGYLAQQTQAEPIMQLEPQDLDREFLAYLYRLHNKLRSDLVAEAPTPIQFQVRESDYVFRVPETPETVGDRQRRGRDDQKDLEEDWSKEGMERNGTRRDADLHDLQEEEDKKALKLEQFRRVLKDLCAGIEEVARNDDNMGRVRAELLEHRLDAAESADAFRKLVAAVKIQQVMGAGGREVMWSDRVPERRDIMRWLNEPNRMGLAMGVWMREARAGRENP